MKKLVVLVAAIALAYVARDRFVEAPADASADRASTSESATRVTRSQSGEIISGSGTVTRILSDDNDGDRHQRFILRLASGQTLLVAHNIDLAPRVSPLDEGDVIQYRGEYVWNDKGGVVHWTHHDPRGSHPGGWLKRNGQVFQ